jgi:hypothetical protein
MLARVQLLTAPEMQVQKWRVQRTAALGFALISEALQTPPFAILIESTPQKKWPSDAVMPLNWKRYPASIPERKMPFFGAHPLSIFVKVNEEADRAVVVPMLAFSKNPPPADYENDMQHVMKCNSFRHLDDYEDVTYCAGEDLSRIALRELCKLT